MQLIKLIAFAIIISCSSVFAQKNIKIIPQPNKIELGEGEFTLNTKTQIIASKELQNEVNFLADVLKKGFNKNAKIQSKGKGITLAIDPTLKSQYGEEGYILLINTDEVSIKSASSTGVFYGVQSFRQLLPTDFEYSTQPADILIPTIKITDTPRFPWRAFMLDESRHFKGSEEVKKLLDQMALLKMNTFHWHLTDDQGWRIEIKKYPKLTEIGSKRADTQTERKSDKRTGEPHEGFYTQKQIKEIIEYATERHITIVPEIEMPGHAMAAVAAYPWLGSLGTTTAVPETFGKMDDSFNIADPKVITFLKDVLDEVIALFPGEVVHIGGDEVNFEPWEKSEEVQKFMKENGLKSPVDLQVYFTNQISNYIDSKGKRMMGWNEIMGDNIHEENQEKTLEVEQKLANSAIVHFWKGDLNLITRAVKDGYNVVNSNHWDTYLDYTFERTPLSKSYAFNPIPEGLEEKYHSYILGFGTQMWTEWLPTQEKLERQIFPRLAAYSEVGWTNLANKDFTNFEDKLEKLKQRWNLAGVYFYDGEKKLD
ncbi:beta-N-acetylhexosaminidase [Chondrinema litorale]|uniref:beta-N-acetylhexosaminidase n=1 Tax=Chondrinema litorale TaxID=2994555 RepID=UPI002542702F|nr:beta-N-acetylhexosaminidase [Chondrinema litorale]UZR96414.1 beta-N-acetylhexosaminidase [Chondrinema litorale]